MKRNLWELAVLEEAEAEKEENEKPRLTSVPAKKKARLPAAAAAYQRPVGRLDDGQVSAEVLRDRGLRFGRAVSPVVTEEEKARSQEIHELRLRVIGTCQDLEKPYLRLTTLPNPATIRPPDVLKRALAHVLERYETDGDYPHALEQFKSIRQDLTVQSVDDDLAVSVYEHNARTSLSVADYGEYSQCQARLFTLYELAKQRAMESAVVMKTKKKKKKAKSKKSHQAAGPVLASINEGEFRAYRVLFQCMMNDTVALNSVLNEELAVSIQWQQPIVRTALTLVHAVQTKDYLSFYKALKMLPTKGPARRMLKQLRRGMRDSAVRALFSSFRPTLPIVFIRKVLGFKKCVSCRAFLIKNYHVTFAELPPSSASSTKGKNAKKKSKEKKSKEKKKKGKESKNKAKKALEETIVGDKNTVDVTRSLAAIAASRPPQIKFKVF